MANKQNVMAGKPNAGEGIGAVYRAPLGTPIPTDARTPLPGAFVELGYVSSDGWTRRIEKAYATVNAWGGDEILKSRNEHSVGFDLTLVEILNGDAQSAKWGEAAVEKIPATAEHGNQVVVTYTGADTEPAVWVLDMNDTGKLHRTIFPYAEDKTESFEQTFSDEEVIGLPFEMSAYRDETTGAYFIDYTDDGKKVAA